MALISSSSSSIAPTSTRLPATLSPKPFILLRVGSSRPTLFPRRGPSLFLSRSADNGAGTVTSSSTTVLKEVQQEEKKEEAAAPSPVAPDSEVDGEQESVGSNGSAVKAKAKEAVAEPALRFKDPRWVGGTWDLTQFQKSGRTDWDAVIDAEARRRKWLEDNPESSTTEEPVIFDTSIIPWWSWVKRFHLPEAEKLNGGYIQIYPDTSTKKYGPDPGALAGRAAMVGFFMAYFVDSLTGVGLVDQMGNFFCKTLLLVAVLGVLFVRKNEDFETLKKLYEETTFYDKQWQATWQEDESSSDSNK